MNLKAEAAPLVRYDAMCRAIRNCSSVDEAKEIRNKAIALATYSKQALNRDNERKCCEIRIRAERRAGQLLHDREKAKGGTPHKKSYQSNGATSRARTLSDDGLTKDQSSDWQKLAAVPEKQFELELQKPGVPTTEQILRNANPKPKGPDPLKDVTREALAVWGAITELERAKLLDADPRELFKQMTKPMQRDIARLSPIVISWLQIFPKGESK